MYTTSSAGPAQRAPPSSRDVQANRSALAP